MYYQIGTAEPHDCVGSRAAKSVVREEAEEECRLRSTGRGIREAWLRLVEHGHLGDVIVTYVKGEQVPLAQAPR